MKTQVDVLERQTKDLTVCDNCSREVDEAGVEDHECDFCSVCSPEFVDGDPPRDVMTAEQWTSTEYGGSVETPQTNLKLVEISLVAMGVFSTVVCAIMAVLLHRSGLGNEVLLPIFGVMGSILVLGTASACLHDFKDQYVEAVE